MALRRVPPRSPLIDRVEVGPVRLYLDDIDDLLVFLRSRCEMVEMTIPDGTADEAQDLRDATATELTWVTVRTEKPGIWVNLSDVDASVSFSGDQPEARNLRDETARLLQKRRTSKIGKRIQFTLVMLGVIAGGMASMLPGASWLVNVTGFGLVVAFAVWVILIAQRRIRTPLAYGAHIIPYRRHEIRAHRRNWWGILIPVTIGAAVTILVGWWQIAADK